MKNIHVLPTPKPSRLHYSKVKTDEKISYKLILKQESLTCNDGLLSGQKNIYITSDEEIKEGDWFYDTYCNVVSKLTVHGKDNRISEFKKIILTTDQDLIKDGIQAIDDEFLEWFIKNPSCEEVEVFQEIHHFGEVVDESYPKGFFDYKIIIPKEEQKELRRKLFTLIKSLEQEEPKQETLEEFIRKAYLSRLEDCLPVDFEDGVKVGVKWQQERMYSEEEMLQALNIGFTSTDETWEECVEFTKEQFKKR